MTFDTPERGLTILFFGSGPFAVPVLDRLRAVAAADEKYRLALTVTRPGRQAGRGRTVRITPVEEFARAQDLEFVAPPSANDAAFLDSLEALHPDLFVVCDYGEFLRQRFRALPRIGSYNLHASLLPKYRGAAPVAQALLRGEGTTGVTLFRIVKAMDGGPVVDPVEVTVSADETAGELEDRLAVEAAGLLERNLPAFLAGTFRETAQNEAAVSHAPKLRKEQGAIDWSRSAVEIEHHVRGLNPWPGAYSFLQRVGAEQGKPERIRFLRVRAVPGSDSLPDAAGRVVGIDKARLAIACREGVVEALELQRSGKTPLSTADFLRGCHLREGDYFSS